MANTLNYNHLYYFHTVASEGSLKAAAKKLEVTQPTISEQLRSLEAVLNGPVFDRSGGRLRLNEAGRELFRETGAMFTVGERIRQRFVEGGSEERELLRVGVTSSLSASFSASYLLPLLADQSVQVRLEQGTHDRVYRAMTAWELDLMLCSERPTHLEEKGLRCELLSTAPMIAVASPERAKSVASFPDDLRGQPFCTYLGGSQRRFDLDGYFLGEGIEPRIYVETNDLGLMLEAARDGQCVSFLPEPSLGDALGQGAVVALGELPAPEAEAFAIYHAKDPAERVTSAVERLRGD